MKRLERRPTPFALSFLAILVVAFGSEEARADNIDPFTYLQANYTVSQWVVDPANEAWGNITGADAINNGTGFVIVYSGGNASFWNDDATITATPFKSIAVTSDATGISEILLSYGGQLAVTDSTGIDFWDLDGNYKGGRGTTLSSIRDITYDVERDRIILSSHTGCIDVLNPDGSLSDLVGSNPYGIEAINLGKDENENPIDDMLQSDSAFYRMLTDGSLSGIFDTDLGAGLTIQGIAYTQNHAIMAVEVPNSPDYLVVYDKLAFQDYIDETNIIPEPQTMIMLGAGAAFLLAAAGKNYFRKNGITKCA